MLSRKKGLQEDEAAAAAEREGREGKQFKIAFLLFFEQFQMF